MCRTMRKSPTKYSEEFKLSVLRDYYSSGMSKRKCAKKYGLCNADILLLKCGRPHTAVILLIGLWMFNIIINFADRYLAAVRTCNEERHHLSRLNNRPG